MVSPLVSVGGARDGQSMHKQRDQNNDRDGNAKKKQQK
jgi:hypothetical protein